MQKILSSTTILLSLLLFSTLAFTHGTEKHGKGKDNISNKPDAKYAWKVKWNSLDEGVKKARTVKKPMLVDFASHEGCPRCEFLQNNVYSKDEIVTKINRDFIPVLIYLGNDLTSDEQTLGEKHEFHNDCLLLFLDKNKEPIFDDQGKKMCFADEIEPQVFIQYLDDVIQIYHQKNIH